MTGDDRLEDLAFPDRDPSLRALVRKLSEPDSGKAADNLVSNEDSYPRVAGEVAKLAPEGSVYLGVGPDQNFTLIAAARARLAFIVDFRRRNLRLHLLHKALVELSPDRSTYLSRLTAREPKTKLKPDADAAAIVEAFSHPDADPRRLARTTEEVWDCLRPLGVLADDERTDLAKIQAKLAGPGLSARFLALPMYPTLAKLVETTDREGKPAHWLATAQAYEEIRKRQTSDRVVPLTGDLAGSGALPSLGRWLRSHRLALGVVYASDVEFFLLRSGKLGRFAENLAACPRAPGAILVRTSTREIKSPERAKGDSSTTIVRPLDRFIADAKAGRFATPDDLFRPA